MKMTRTIEFVSDHGFEFNFEVTFDREGIIYTISLNGKDRTEYFEKLPAFMAELKEEINYYVMDIPDYSEDPMKKTYEYLDSWIRNGGY